MPLEIVVERDGKPLELLWDYVTLSCVLTAALKESDPEREYDEGKTYGELPAEAWVNFSMSPIYYLDTKSPLWTKGTYTLKQAHTFGVLSEWKKNHDRKPIILKPGDKIEMWRSHK